ncbi:Alpha-L-arabinofuranosidase 1 [Zea mays]|uniref:Alpha-L-arabinofuranosidase 1 n=1 Tax=Zea mays TaxID=4577 RepID=A0A1D6K130_MAIZE|nr:Alpha-L-arabinofuranosidase 1 [Zea mays]
MGIRACSVCWLFYVLVLVCSLCQILYVGSVAAQTAQLTVDASPQNAQIIPGNMFGIFFEEINHAGAGGLWAELVSNRGNGNSMPKVDQQSSTLPEASHDQFDPLFIFC